MEDEYGLTAQEILDAISERFRAKVALEGVVAEARFEKKLRALERTGTVHRYERHDRDDHPDFSVWPSEGGAGIRIEVKNVRDDKEAYRRGGEVVAYKVELQKTRRGEDPSSRYYDVDKFDVVAVCLGKKTRNWGDFYFAKTADLGRSSKYPDKLDVMHGVPLPGSADIRPWFDDLEDLLTAMRREEDGR